MAIADYKCPHCKEVYPDMKINEPHICDDCALVSGEIILLKRIFTPPIVKSGNNVNMPKNQ